MEHVQCTVWDEDYDAYLHPTSCCTPTHTHTHKHTHPHTSHTYMHNTHIQHTHTHICTCDLSQCICSDKSICLIDHNFLLSVKSCWREFLFFLSFRFVTLCSCPPSLLPPQEVIATVVPTYLFKRYTTLNLQQFVSEYRAVKWCPRPGCGLAVGTPEQKSSERKEKKAGLNAWCGKGHAFCW